MLVDESDEDETTTGEVVSEEPQGENCACAGGKSENPDEIALEMDEDEEEGAKMEVAKAEVSSVEIRVEEPKSEERSTRFLALSKPGPGKDFLQVSLGSFLCTASTQLMKL